MLWLLGMISGALSTPLIMHEMAFFPFTTNVKHEYIELTVKFQNNVTFTRFFFKQFVVINMASAYTCTVKLTSFHFKAIFGLKTSKLP